MQVIINTMEDYEYKVIKLHATQSRNSSKFTSNISKHTGKFTSKTNQIRLGGAMGGGPTPNTSLSQTVVDHSFLLPGPLREPRPLGTGSTLGVRGETTTRPTRLGGKQTATPLRLSIFPDFLARCIAKCSQSPASLAKCIVHQLA